MVSCDMARLTITLSEERHQALKDRAARTGKTVDELIEESLEQYGIRMGPTARELIQRAREHSALPEEEALDTALAETRAVRSARSRRDPGDHNR